MADGAELGFACSREGESPAQDVSSRVRLARGRWQWVCLLDAAGKRMIDVLGAITLLVLGSPILLLMAAVIRIDGGPAFYAHWRVGRNGVSFPCWKYRTMVLGAEELITEYLRYNPDAQAEWQNFFFLKTDPRVTPIGHLLRKTSIDEVPQLWNVLRGQMSLVGPRPVTAKELANHYGKHAALVTSVRPGITGPWQLTGRYRVSYEARVKMDTEYVKHRSFLGDMSILLKTVSPRSLLRPAQVADAAERARQMLPDPLTRQT